MLPELLIIFKLLLVVVLVYAIVVWLGVVFQNIKFQKYRLFKNEAAYRKARLHDEDLNKRKYRGELLGEVIEGDESSSRES